MKSLSLIFLDNLFTQLSRRDLKLLFFHPSLLDISRQYNEDDIRFLIFLRFFEEYHKEPMNWDILSRNRSLSMRIVEKYIDRSWDWRELSIHPNLTMYFVEKHSGYPWDWGWEGLSRNPNQ